MEVESILVHEDYQLYPINYEAGILTMIKLKNAVQILETTASISVSENPISSASRCFVGAGGPMDYHLTVEYGT
uniref:Uncharacterized protein n=1 Tax=Romanomermis culicivorax TaxID=13658 RepID=A0A915HJD7_ROMCU